VAAIPLADSRLRIQLVMTDDAVTGRAMPRHGRDYSIVPKETPPAGGS
jgi:hypothetical protein